MRLHGRRLRLQGEGAKRRVRFALCGASTVSGRDPIALDLTASNSASHFSGIRSHTPFPASQALARSNQGCSRYHLSGRSKVQNSTNGNVQYIALSKKSSRSAPPRWCLTSDKYGPKTERWHREECGTPSGTTGESCQGQFRELECKCICMHLFISTWPESSRRSLIERRIPSSTWQRTLHSSDLRCEDSLLPFFLARAKFDMTVSFGSLNGPLAC